MDKFYSKGLDDTTKNAFEQEGTSNKQLPDWDKMEALLDKEMPQQKKRRPILFWFLLAGLFIGGSYLIYSSNKKQESTPISNQAKANQQINNNNAKQDHSNLDAQIINKESAKEKVIIFNTIKSSSKNHLINKGQTKERKIIDKQEEYNSNKQQQNKQSNTVREITSNKESYNAKDQLLNQRSAKEIIIESKQENIIVKEGLTKLNHSLDSVKMGQLNVDSTNKESNDSSKKIINPKASKWEWIFSVAPDFLLANIQPLYRPGFSIGLGINYIISPNWRLRTGLLYNYSPINELGVNFNYKPSPNLPSYTSIELRNVKGNLNVFEVPLSVRYTAKPNKKLSFIASAGLSSLFFIKQQYTYDLLLNGNTPLIWNSANDTDDSGESHILNNLTIGTGISVKTKRNVVLEIEPMFKLPLEELGEGHGKLGTIAIYFNFRMPINKSKK